MAQQHKASILPQKHGKLEVGTRPTPVPQGTQALVKVTAAAINPIDWKIIDYGIFIENFPAVLGFNGAGVIHAVGQEVTNFKVGDRVYVSAFSLSGTVNPDYASYQEYALVDTDTIAKTPNNINDDQASTISVGAVTAYLGLFQGTGIVAPLSAPTANGKPLLILGGSSSVGQFGKHTFANAFHLHLNYGAAIQLARIAGFSPIVTTASSQHAEFLKSLGATHVFDRNADVRTLHSVFSTPVALVFDTVSEEGTQLLAFDVLTAPSPVSGARLIVLLPQVDSFKKKNSGDKIAVDEVDGGSEGLKDVIVPFWQKIGQWVEGGELVPNRVQLVNGGLAGIPGALDLSRKGVSGVKLVVRPQE
ncbi:unnamed protein product [Rhizoctonia solani]|uniref:Enoyl reductase (ER) domain-containing protein n=1 Tax=Rhizoctonia solani TaxID=456999 RepID=A0A8H3GPP1_9AGAM|nr:unnamed protein product [Rhizoctonia solani]